MKRIAFWLLLFLLPSIVASVWSRVSCDVLRVALFPSAPACGGLGGHSTSRINPSLRSRTGLRKAHCSIRKEQ